jgi:hypothetical protein
MDEDLPTTEPMCRLHTWVDTTAVQLTMTDVGCVVEFEAQPGSWLYGKLIAVRRAYWWWPPRITVLPDGGGDVQTLRVHPLTPVAVWR